MRDFTEWLRRAYDNVVKQRPKKRDDRGYAGVPEASRVANRLSGRAVFASCVRRRVGYVVHVIASEFEQLRPSTGDNPIRAERKAWMEDAWHRGVIWMPLLVEAEVQGDRWEIKRFRDLDVARFLADRQHTITVQVVEKDDAPGTPDKLALLDAYGLGYRKRRCSVLFARVTY